MCFDPRSPIYVNTGQIWGIFGTTLGRSFTGPEAVLNRDDNSRRTAADGDGEEETPPKLVKSATSWRADVSKWKAPATNRRISTRVIQTMKSLPLRGLVKPVAKGKGKRTMQGPKGKAGPAVREDSTTRAALLALKKRRVIGRAIISDDEENENVGVPASSAAATTDACAAASVLGPSNAVNGVPPQTSSPLSTPSPPLILMPRFWSLPRAIVEIDRGFFRFRLEHAWCLCAPAWCPGERAEKKKKGVSRVAAIQDQICQHDERDRVTAARPDLVTAQLKRTVAAKSAPQAPPPRTPSPPTRSTATSDGDELMDDIDPDDRSGESPGDGFNGDRGDVDEGDGDKGDGAYIDSADREEGKDNGDQDMDEDEDDIRDEVAAFARKLRAKKQKEAAAKAKPKKAWIPPPAPCAPRYILRKDHPPLPPPPVYCQEAGDPKVVVMSDDEYTELHGSHMGPRSPTLSHRDELEIDTVNWRRTGGNSGARMLAELAPALPSCPDDPPPNGEPPTGPSGPRPVTGRPASGLPLTGPPIRHGTKSAIKHETYADPSDQPGHMLLVTWESSEFLLFGFPLLDVSFSTILRLVPAQTMQ
ncbi:hypothetical protein B0H13DRAFT_1853636 [Mycena leptocephala]|nr:hypothetical protein B0H13DRAFT_1853636 [Mycena leptocephala]